MDGQMEELSGYPSHFNMEAITKLHRSNLQRMKARVKEDTTVVYAERLEHELCRDQNLLLILDFLLSGIAGTFAAVEEAKRIVQDYPESVIAWANLGALCCKTRDTEAVEECLQKLEAMGPWEKLLGRAELAYTYGRIGGAKLVVCKSRYEEVLAECGQIAEQEGKGKDLADGIETVWKYDLALTIERIMNPGLHYALPNDFNKEGDDPERFLRRACELSSEVVSSNRRYYVAKAWLCIHATFAWYKRLRPKGGLRLEDLPEVGRSQRDCLENAIEVVETVARQDHTALYLIGRAFRRYPFQDLDRAELYLRRASELSEAPGIYHHLALVCRQKWRGTRFPRSKAWENPRDQNSEILLRAIGYLEKAIEYSSDTCGLFVVELARCKFSYYENLDEKKDEILNDLKKCLMRGRELGNTAENVETYAYHQMALMYEHFGERTKCLDYLKMAVEKDVAGEDRPWVLEKLRGMVAKDVADAPDSIKNRAMAEMYLAPQARDYYKTVRDDDVGIIRNKLIVFCRLKEWKDARQCLKLLMKREEDALERDPALRQRFLQVYLADARRYLLSGERFLTVVTYREMLGELVPEESRYVFCILSSESPDDKPRTEQLHNYVRSQLGLTKEQCVSPWRDYYELVDKCGVDMSMAIENCVERSWCVLIHLTDAMLRQEELVYLIRRSVKTVMDRRGQVVVFDDRKEKKSLPNEIVILDNYPMIDVIPCGSPTAVASADFNERFMRALFTVQEGERRGLTAECLYSRQ